ncbi:MAG TPA: ATP synthase F1 subunit delta [Phycisphaerales bacterium]|nr:ATP synthase F1 subunit delta [Phycisphaerales bacterium]
MSLSETHSDSLARVYAGSLFQLAREEGGQARIEEVQGELEEILELARSDRGFAEFLSSRVLPAAKRAGSLERIFAGRVTPLTLRFLHVLNEKDRLGRLVTIAAAYDDMVQEAFGRVEVDVYTPAPLEARELEAIRTKLRTVLGREPVVHAYTDPKMLGGLRVQVGDQLIDGSISTRLRKFRDALAVGGAAALRERFDRMVMGEPGGNGQAV